MHQKKTRVILKSRLQNIQKNMKKTQIQRRSFIKGILSGTAVMALSTGQAAHGFSFTSFFQKFFQKHYKKLSSKEKKVIFQRLKEEAREKYSVDITVSDPQPIPGVKFAYFLDLSKCNGSRKCVEACAKENNQDPSVGGYIKVFEMPKGTKNLEKGNCYYLGDQVPKKDKFYFPVSCHQCDNPPCVKACPTEATWKQKDGIVVIDYDWCIGCRYCQAACPYEARYFNFKKPKTPQENINTNQGYLSNRFRSRGVVEKCHFCAHRTRKGKYPACLEACPTGARKFGNILDPKSEVSHVFKNKSVFVLKEEMNTIPSFYYFFS